MIWLLFLDIFLKFIVFLYLSTHLYFFSSSFSCHRDGNLPVSFIQKYLVKKLDLTSEAEVSSQFHFPKIDSP